MKTLLPFLLLFALSAFGQPAPINRHAMIISGLASGPSTPDTPQSIPGLAYWWVYTDLVTNNNVVTWTDRIQGSVLTNGVIAQQPTNSALGVYFKGTSLLTNTVEIDGGASDTSHFVIIQKTRANCEPYLGSSGSLRPLFYLAVNACLAAADWYEVRSTTPADSSLTSTPCKTNAFVCLVLGHRATGFSDSFTNGVAARLNVAIAPRMYFRLVGGDLQGNFMRGYIKEIGIWTNTTLTSVNASNLNYYATNTYGYTP